MIQKIAIALALALLAFASMGEAKTVAKKHVVHKAATAKFVAKKPAVVHASAKKPTVMKKVVRRIAAVPKKAAAKVGTVFVRSLTSVLARLKTTYAGSMDAIKSAYRPAQRNLGIARYDDLVNLTRRTVDDDGEIVREIELVPIPYPEHYNIQLRTKGRGMIGEADKTGNDITYYQYTRKFVAGSMIELGSKLQHAKLDVAAVSRTYEYQGWLLHGPLKAKAAATDFPSHALAIAFDVGLLQTSLEDVGEILQVADLMRTEGKIIVHPEAHDSRCIHIVPTEEYQKYFEEVYDQAMLVAN
jgi:hypothetical protein